MRLFKSCEVKWLLSKIGEEAADERSLPMEFGSAIHSAMELMWDPDSNTSVERAGEIFIEQFDKNCIGLELSTDEDEEHLRLRELGPRMLSDAWTCPELQGIRPLSTELDLMEPIMRTDGLDMKFKGFVDFIFVKQLKRKRVIYVADFKTCTWGWPAKKAMDPEVTAQVLLYKHFLCRMLGADPSDVTAAFILLKKTPRDGDPSVEVLKIPSGPKAVRSAVDLLQSTITAMNSGSYRRNRDVCTRTWTDRKSGEERTFRCPFLGVQCPEIKAPDA